MLFGVFAVAGVLLLFTTFVGAASGQAKHARWDIVRLTSSGGVTTVNAGGFAEAKTPEGATIRISGTGTFVAPSGSNGGSGAVTGGGTWSINGGAGGSGTYTVEELVSFAFANFQSPGLADTIGDTNERANGTAVFRVAYSDGSQGVLTVGCHGPGAPPGIFEGIAVTKNFTTFYAVQPPGADPTLNRTIFHVRR
jgi:hypothetical protein